jgi:hypothetical protein
MLPHSYVLFLKLTLLLSNRVWSSQLGVEASRKFMDGFFWVVHGFWNNIDDK